METVCTIFSVTEQTIDPQPSSHCATELVVTNVILKQTWWIYYRARLAAISVIFLQLLPVFAVLSKSFLWSFSWFPALTYQKDRSHSCVLLSTLPSDLLRGTFAVHVRPTPLICAVLKRAPPSYTPCFPSHLEEPNKARRPAVHATQTRCRSPVIASVWDKIWKAGSLRKDHTVAV